MTTIARRLLSGLAAISCAATLTIAGVAPAEASATSQAAPGPTAAQTESPYVTLTDALRTASSLYAKEIKAPARTVALYKNRVKLTAVYRTKVAERKPILDAYVRARTAWRHAPARTRPQLKKALAAATARLVKASGAQAVARANLRTAAQNAAAVKALTQAAARYESRRQNAEAAYKNATGRSSGLVAPPDPAGPAAPPTTAAPPVDPHIVGPGPVDPTAAGGMGSARTVPASRGTVEIYYVRSCFRYGPDTYSVAFKFAAPGDQILDMYYGPNFLGNNLGYILTGTTHLTEFTSSGHTYQADFDFAPYC